MALPFGRCVIRCLLAFALAYAIVSVLLLRQRHRYDEAVPHFAKRPEARPKPAADVIAALAPCTEPQRCDSVLSRSAESMRLALVGVYNEMQADVRNWPYLDLPSNGQKTIVHDVPDVGYTKTAELDLPFENQLVTAVSDAASACGYREVLFTVLDAAYSDLMVDVEATFARSGSNNLIFVSLDRATAEAGLRLGLRIVMLQVENATKKEMIYLAKYYTASLLCEAQIRFLFFEMDIWMPRREGQSILDVFRAAAASRRAFLGPPAAAWALHTDNPYIINAGIYYIRPDVDPLRPLLLFEAIVSYSRRLPIFDQGLMNCLLKLSASPNPGLRFIRERDSCHEKDHPVKTDDPAILRYLAASKNANFNWTLVDALVAASYSYPFLLRDTLAVHVLTSTPLTSSSGKKVVAKELMLWEGGGDPDYFRIGNTHKYLALDGPLSSSNGIDDFEALQARLSVLVDLADDTERVLILPSITYLGRRVPAWEALDTSRIQYGWRETTFFDNPRLEISDTAKILRIKVHDDSGIILVAPLAGYSSRQSGRVYKTRLSSTLEEALALVTRLDPLAVEADLIFVSVHQPKKKRLDDRFCEYKHRESRKATLLAAHFDCGVIIESTAKMVKRSIEKSKERKAQNRAIRLGYNLTKAPTPAPIDEIVNPSPSLAPMLTRFGRVRARQKFATEIKASLARKGIHSPPPDGCPSCFFGIIPTDTHSSKQFTLASSVRKNETLRRKLLDTPVRRR